MSPRIPAAAWWITAFVVAAGALPLAACPFCGAIQPTFAERRESAAVTALAEVESARAGRTTFRLHQLVRAGGAFAADDRIATAVDADYQPGDLAFLFGTLADDASSTWNWDTMPAQAESVVYFARSPGLRIPAAERLRYYLDFLESTDSDIAADAYAEFGRAPLEAVEAVLDGEAIAGKLRSWVMSPELPDARRGLYGLMLGLSQDEEIRRENAHVLRQVIDTPREDFRSGFDGLLAGYLLLEPQEAITQIRERYIANREARPGDSRHAFNALRFCIEYRRGPDRSQVLEVVRQGLGREAFAAEIVVDLARWQDWSALDTIAELYAAHPEADAAQLRLAVIGYLKVSPEAAARAHLERLRQLDPHGVADIERRLQLPRLPTRR